MAQISGGLSMLKVIESRLPLSEKKIAQYIQNHPDAAVTMTAQELGESSNSSSAAVVRLCKSMKLSSFQDLKMRIAGDLQQNDSFEYRDIQVNEPVVNIIDQMTYNTVSMISETKDYIQKEIIETALEWLESSSKIIIYGIGASGIIAYDCQQKFLRVGLNSYYFEDPHLTLTTLAHCGPDDLAIFISFSGETKETINILKQAKKLKVRTLGITKYGKSPMSDLVDCAIYSSPKKEAISRSAATSTRIAQLHIIDILFMSYVSKNFQETIDSIDKSKKLVENDND